LSLRIINAGARSSSLTMMPGLCARGVRLAPSILAWRAPQGARHRTRRRQIGWQAAVRGDSWASGYGGTRIAVKKQLKLYPGRRSVRQSSPVAPHPRRREAHLRGRDRETTPSCREGQRKYLSSRRARKGSLLPVVPDDSPRSPRRPSEAEDAQRDRTSKPAPLSASEANPFSAGGRSPATP